MILALDPGLTTGWAVYEKIPIHDLRYRSGQVHQDDVWNLLESSHFARDEPAITRLVVERFQYRPHLPKVHLSPVEVIGVVKEWARQHEVDITWQTPAEGKFYYTDKRLKELDVYTPGKPHANDAMRHLWYFIGLGYGSKHKEVLDG